MGDPGEKVDPELITRLREDTLVEEARQVAQEIRRSQGAAKVLEAAGIVDPAGANAEIFFELSERARQVGWERCRIGDIPRLTQLTNQYADRIEQQARSKIAISNVFGLGSDPELGSLRLVCSAVEFAQELDPAWAIHRRAGLERHWGLLEEAATRSETVRAKLIQVQALLDVSDVSTTTLNNAAAALEAAGTFAVFRSEFRDARRLFVLRWRGGPRPHRSEWARLLRDAASALSDLEALRNDPDLRRVLAEPEDDPSALPLASIASAARWQHQLHAYFSEAGMEGAHIASLLVSLDASQFQRIAAMAGAARALRAFIEEAQVADDRPWSALQQAAKAAIQATAEISSLVTDAVLDPAMYFSDLPALGAAVRDWQTATTKLASKQTTPLLAGVPLSPEVIESTCSFAAAVFEALPSGAAGLLGDGWTLNIRRLRGIAGTVRDSLKRVLELLERLRPPGLGNFASEASSQTLGSIAAAAQRFLTAKEELAAYLRFASARAACVADPLANAVVSAFDDASAPIPNPEEALDWLIAWALVRSHAEANRREFGRSGTELSSLRRSFADADRRRLKSDAHQTALAALRRQVPPGTNVGSRKNWTEGALLQNEFGKQQRFIPVRDLLARAGGAVSALTPCDVAAHRSSIPEAWVDIRSGDHGRGLTNKTRRRDGRFVTRPTCCRRG